eukprot:99834_1
MSVLIGSYLLTIAIWILILKPELFSFVPKVTSHSGPSYYDLLPPLPSKMSVAYQLGRLEEQLNRLETTEITNKSDESINTILLQATKLLDRNPKHPINVKQFHGILDHIIKFENKKSMIGSIFGIFSFVNLVWFISIIGISFTIIPVIYFICRPVWKPLWIFCRTYLMETAYVLKNIFIHPYALQLYELFGYFICWYFIYLNYDIYNNEVGFYMAFTGIMLWHPMIYLSLIIREQKYRKQYERYYKSDDGIIYPIL